MERWADRWRLVWGVPPPVASSLAESMVATLAPLVSRRAGSDIGTRVSSPEGAALVSQLAGVAFAGAHDGHPDWIALDVATLTAGLDDVAVLVAAWGKRLLVVHLADTLVSSHGDLAERFERYRKRWPKARAIEMIDVGAASTGSVIHAGPGQRYRRLSWTDVRPVLQRAFPDEATAALLADVVDPWWVAGVNDAPPRRRQPR